MSKLHGVAGTHPNLREIAEPCKEKLISVRMSADHAPLVNTHLSRSSVVLDI